MLDHLFRKPDKTDSYAGASTTKRLIEIDFLRCTAMIWNVCIWHLRPFPAAWVDTAIYPVMHDITQMCLGAFMFSAGYCLAAKYSFHSSRDVFSFYWRRILRIVPLLVIATLTFPELPDVHPHLAQLFACTGLSSYIPTAVAGRVWTVWFVSMLLSFYLLLPALTSKKHPLFAGAILLLFAAGHWLLDWDWRLLDYFPAFYLGTIIGRGGEKRLFQLAAICFPVAILMSILSLHSSIMDVCREFVGFSLFILPAHLLARHSHLRMFYRWGVYVSFCAYLFHRHFFFYYLPLLGPATDPVLRTIQHLLITFPLLFVVSFLIQKAYDMALKPFSRKAA